MLITIVTLQRGVDAEIFVGAVAGSISPVDRAKIVRRHLHEIGSGADSVDEMGFAEIEAAHAADDLELVQWIHDGFETGDMSDDIANIDNIADNMEGECLR